MPASVAWANEFAPAKPKNAIFVDLLAALSTTGGPAAALVVVRPQAASAADAISAVTSSAVHRRLMTRPLLLIAPLAPGPRAARAAASRQHPRLAVRDRDVVLEPDPADPGARRCPGSIVSTCPGYERVAPCAARGTAARGSPSRPRGPRRAGTRPRSLRAPRRSRAAPRRRRAPACPPGTRRSPPPAPRARRPTRCAPSPTAARPCRSASGRPSSRRSAPRRRRRSRRPPPACASLGRAVRVRRRSPNRISGCDSVAPALAQLVRDAGVDGLARRRRRAAARTSAPSTSVIDVAGAPDRAPARPRPCARAGPSASVAGRHAARGRAPRRRADARERQVVLLDADRARAPPSTPASSREAVGRGVVGDAVEARRRRAPAPSLVEPRHDQRAAAVDRHRDREQPLERAAGRSPSGRRSTAGSSPAPRRVPPPRPPRAAGSTRADRSTLTHLHAVDLPRRRRRDVTVADVVAHRLRVALRRIAEAAAAAGHRPHDVAALAASRGCT